VPDRSKFILIQTPDGAVSMDIFFQEETVWLTRKTLAELFGVQAPTIAKHLTNIFESGDLSREATISKMEIVQSAGEQQVPPPYGPSIRVYGRNYGHDHRTPISRP